MNKISGTQNAVIFGAGSVGRGFIGQLLAEGGYSVTFVDISESIVNGINQHHSYPHFTICSTGKIAKQIEPVNAILSLSTNQVMDAIIMADIIATCVGANALPQLAVTLAEGIKRRLQAGLPAINILLCENLHDASCLMRAWLLDCLPDISEDLFDAHIGLLETSIGRMIPAPTIEMTRYHPAAIQVEPYKFLPFDVHAAKGRLPDIPYLIGYPNVPFGFFSDRKLYIHNMGHALCAFLSRLLGFEYIWEGISHPAIRYFVRSAMIESGIALSLRYKQPLQPIISHIDDLLFRFNNKALGDTVERVGRDPRRKLAKGDRLLGAYQMCVDQDVDNMHISLGLAAGLLYLNEVESDCTEDKIMIYLQEQGLFNLKSHRSIQDEKRQTLLCKQLGALKMGFNFIEQIALIEQNYCLPIIV